MNFGQKVKSMTSEGKIQYIFNSLNEDSREYRDNIAYLLNHDPSPIVRHEAAYILGELEGQDCADFLIDAVQKDPNRFVIHEALLALSNRGIADTFSIISKQTDNPDKDIADTALISLQRLEMKLNDEEIPFDIAKSLILDLKSDWEERIQSSFKLMDEGSEESIEILIRAYKQEPNPIVKHEIIFSLGETASKTAAQTLANGIRSETNDFVIHETLLALSTLGFQDHCDVIKEFVSHDSPEVSESAEISLERLGCKNQNIQPSLSKSN